MSVTTTTGEELNLRCRLAFTRAMDLLRGVDPALRLRDSDWTCRDVAVHLLTVMHRYTRRDFTSTSGLGPTVAALTENNAADIEQHAALGYEEALGLLEKEFAAVLDIPVELDERYPFHAGQTIDGAGARANVMGEFLIHGLDVARAASREWPLDARDCVLILNGALQVAPGWLDVDAARGRRLDVAMHIRDATPQLIHIADGRCEVRDLRRGDRPHAVVRGPAEVTLLLLYGRIGLPAAVRRGLLTTGGTRPWRALQLPRMFLTI